MYSLPQSYNQTSKCKRCISSNAYVSYISDFEKHIVDIAGKKECQGVICGHIHYPEKKMIGNVLYLNSGDWMESLSALTEDYDGNWNVYIEEKVLSTRQMEKETIFHTELAV